MGFSPSIVKETTVHSRKCPFFLEALLQSFEVEDLDKTTFERKKG